MIRTKRGIARAGTLLVVIVMLLALTVVAYKQSLAHPPNLLWALFSGYYRYDPRRQTPPAGLMLDRPEASLKYFFDATLKLCGGTYPPLSNTLVQRYEVEEVEYLGHTDYHAFSLLHTRVYFADGASARAVFRFEAGHNEGYRVWAPFLTLDTSTVRAGGWMAVGGLQSDPAVLPPGWTRVDQIEQPFTCNPGQPYAIEATQ